MDKTLMILLAILSFAMSANAEEPFARQLATKTELYAIPSLTLSDEQFLKGDSAAAKPVVVTGELRIAQGSGRLPVVVLVHGSGGMGPNIGLWTREFNEMGVSTFALDAFTGRGLASVNTDQAALGRLNMILDVYRMLDVLAKHPRVDPSRIVLMGFSRGGQATLFASVKRFHEMWNKSGIGFAGYIPFYPDCVTTYRGDTDLVDGPVRIFGGTPDDYNPIVACKAFVERLQAAGRDVRLTEYPNAQHAFDNPLGSLTPTVVKGGQTVRNCRVREDDAGHLINTATGRPFTYKDDCVELGPHVGHDVAATEAAQRSVHDFVKALFKLN